MFRSNKQISNIYLENNFVKNLTDDAEIIWIRRVGQQLFYLMLFFICIIIHISSLIVQQIQSELNILNKIIILIIVIIFYSITSLVGILVGSRIAIIVARCDWLALLFYAFIAGISWGGYTGLISSILGVILWSFGSSIVDPLWLFEKNLEIIKTAWVVTMFFPIPLSLIGSVILRLLLNKRRQRMTMAKNETTQRSGC